ncbi:MAG: hypothetical protein U1E73_10940 [Planctomycetota bacterium]
MNQSILRSLALVALLAGSGVAQCGQQWQPGDPIPFVVGDARASVVYDADGAGPAAPVLVVGGRFSVGTMIETSVAAYDGTDWVPLGSPPFPEVSALLVWNGLLVAAGGTLFQSTVATFNGSVWTPIGSINGRVNAMVEYNFHLLVGGDFTTVNSVSARSVADWNGSVWVALGSGVAPRVDAMVVFGSLYVGGNLTNAGTLPLANLAMWSGTAWSAAATFDAPVRSLAARNGPSAATSFLFAGGEFTTVGTVAASRFARLSPSTGTWTGLPGLPGPSCSAIHVRGTSLTTFELNAAAGGNPTNGGVFRLVGGSWTPLGGLTSTAGQRAAALAYFQGRYFAAIERLPGASSPPSGAVRVYDGTSWQHATGSGFGSPVFAVTATASDLVVGGSFVSYGTTVFGGIARGGPGAWQPLGTGTDGTVYSLCTLPGGDIVAGGSFTTAGGNGADAIARWNGSGWQPLGAGVNGIVYSVVPLPNGDLVAGGAFATAGGVPASNIARWNGTAWSPLGGGVDAQVRGLARAANGDLLAVGFFTHAGGQPANRIARWNGSSWSALGSGLDDGGLGVAELPDGDVVVGGVFTTAGGVSSPNVARWNGSAWLAQSTATLAWNDTVERVVALPNGDYFAVGRTSTFGAVATPANVARHTGGAGSLQWTPFELVGSWAFDAVLAPNGDLVVGGDFRTAGGAASHDLALLRPSCAATSAPYGSGCTGSGGPNQLAATALPWTGGAFRGRATGMPANGVVFAVTGFSQLQLSLPALLPQGHPGCFVLASADIVQLAGAAAGVAATQFPLPNSTALAGVMLNHQVIPFELGAGGSLVGVSATNGLVLTIGSL